MSATDTPEELELDPSDGRGDVVWMMCGVCVLIILLEKRGALWGIPAGARLCHQVGGSIVMASLGKLTPAWWSPPGPWPLCVTHSPCQPWAQLLMSGQQVWESSPELRCGGMANLCSETVRARSFTRGMGCGKQARLPWSGRLQGPSRPSKWGEMDLLD